MTARRRTTATGHRPKVVSLFTGCGGSDAGLIAADYEIVFANDISKYAEEVYKANLPETDYKCKDICGIKTFPAADLLVGCYPCQGFSQGGARSDLGIRFTFPAPTHTGADGIKQKTVREALDGMPEWPEGEFLDDGFHWHYLSRNRRCEWTWTSDSPCRHRCSSASADIDHTACAT